VGAVRCREAANRRFRRRITTNFAPHTHRLITRAVFKAANGSPLAIYLAKQIILCVVYIARWDVRADYACFVYSKRSVILSRVVYTALNIGIIGSIGTDDATLGADFLAICA
jgi:hypothetical protein